MHRRAENEGQLSAVLRSALNDRDRGAKLTREVALENVRPLHFNFRNPPLLFGPTV